LRLTRPYKSSKPTPSNSHCRHYKVFGKKNFVVTWGRKIIEKSFAKIERFLNGKSIYRRPRATGDPTAAFRADAAA
jgi:hypothetical protein